MSSNLGCIGMTPTDEDSFSRLMVQLSEKASVEASGRGSLVHRRWADPSGASIAFHVKADDIACITPFFAPEDGLTRWSVQTTQPWRDEQCVHCSGADCDVLDASGELVTRATVQWLHFLPWQKWLETPHRFELEVVAFARAAQVFDGPEAFFAAQEKELTEARAADASSETLPRFAENAFLPTGMFSEDEPDRATAVFAGRITRVEHRVNTQTGGDFHRLRVHTLPGEIDVVLSECDGEPQVGAIAWIDAWLVGRPVDPPPPPPERGLLRQLFS